MIRNREVLMVVLVIVLAKFLSWYSELREV